MRWLRDWLTSLPDAELRRSRFVRKSFDTGEPDRDETPLEWLNRISKLGR